MDPRFSSALSPGKEATLGIGPGLNAERKDVMFLTFQESDNGGGGRNYLKLYFEDQNKLLTSVHLLTKYDFLVPLQTFCQKL
jgi:hypothetical protein